MAVSHHFGNSHGSVYTLFIAPRQNQGRVVKLNKKTPRYLGTLPEQNSPFRSWRPWRRLTLKLARVIIELDHLLASERREPGAGAPSAWLSDALPHTRNLSHQYINVL